MRVLIVDDHGIVREGLKTLFNSEEDIEVVGTAQNGLDALELAKELSPDIVIMDITMPEMNGVEATRELLVWNPGTKVIVLSIHSERNLVIEVLRAGAAGYVLKTYLFDELVRAVRSVVTDGYYLSPRIADVVVGQLLESFDSNTHHEKNRLTPTERQILQLISEGKSTKQIAKILHKSPKTIDSRRRQIADKVGASGVAELTKYAIREGITSVEC
jgi:DNA-binding NarL/FixJ family response regulator